MRVRRSGADRALWDEGGQSTCRDAVPADDVRARRWSGTASTSPTCATAWRSATSTDVFAARTFGVIVSDALDAGGRVRGISRPGRRDALAQAARRARARSRRARGAGGLDLGSKRANGGWKGQGAKFLGSGRRAAPRGRGGRPRAGGGRRRPDHVQPGAAIACGRTSARRHDLRARRARMPSRGSPISRCSSGTRPRARWRAGASPVHLAASRTTCRCSRPSPAACRALALRRSCYNGNELGGGCIRITRSRRCRRRIFGCSASTTRRRTRDSASCSKACAPARRRTAASRFGFDRITMLLAGATRCAT